ncbi:hypothetical protein SQ03_06920 [Methylobacterium platani JCM 14648]|uniref:Aldehyde oxidase/xanthine dehydrogenase first molybdopterin binding domain-containing protein n=2 Tax=Methylobacterium platani TaxID=427683 RepID=A0A179RZT2_9HYPH|nr:hypothetical protein SQ03_06920 [Methylobacterium platani JCM 14648]OAS18094.1 hypothetical protein A5481_27150 [Methylobacterium platani]
MGGEQARQGGVRHRGAHGVAVGRAVHPVDPRAQAHIDQGAVDAEEQLELVRRQGLGLGARQAGFRPHVGQHQNKAPTCQYRAVGHPVATMVAEGLVDLGAARLGLDPLGVRERDVIPYDAYPCAGVSGIERETLSHQAALARPKEMMGYDSLRAEQSALREQGIHRGIGLAAFIEITNPSAAFDGVGGARISSQDG